MRGVLFGCLVLSMLLLTACAGNHRNQPKYEPLEESSLFANDQSARPIPDDTVARGQLREDSWLYTGKQNGEPVRGFPFPVTKAVMERGRQRFDVNCVPCHGETGKGDGMIVRRGYSPPPTYHSDALRQVEEGYLFDVITNGFGGGMPPYGDQVSPRDRWAIIAYIRALQLSQNSNIRDVPPQVRDKLNAGGK